jgi:putative CocE/NonD family hydrolase
MNPKPRMFTARIIAALGFGAACAGPTPAQTTQPATRPASQPAALPATMAGFSDKGTFGLFVNEDQIATIDFQWQADGSFTNTCTIAMAGQSVTQTLRITPGADGRFQEIVDDVPTGSITLERDGGTVTRTHEGKTDTLRMKPGAVLFENLSPALMSQAVLQYDNSAGGKQTFPLFIVPRIVMEASLEPLDTVERRVGDEMIKFYRYTYHLPGVDITTWFDEDHKLCLADVPAQHARYVRRGYESLYKSAEREPEASTAEHEIIVESNTKVPMRDGVELATDIYRPADERKFPVILVRTPYKKEMIELQGRFYARRGYVCAIQDCRGRFASPGKWRPFFNEAHDGYDTIEWLAAQPWSTGKVGTIGASYLGWVQWWAAGQNPPHLTTIIPNVSPPDPFYNIPYEYGTFFLLGSIWWADVLENEATADLSGVAMSRIGEKKYTQLLRDLPVIDLDKKVLGKENAYWREWIQHPVNDDFWAPANFLDRLKNVNIPVFHQSGWFDGDGIGSKLNYAAMRAAGHPNQKLILGPWGHTATAQRMIGDRDFGEAAIIDLQNEYVRWFDHWLKGEHNGVGKEPLVRIFVMGTNKWLHGDVYPLPETRFERWHFTSAGHANTSTGDGKLARATPPADTPPDRYTYDPADPTPHPDMYEEPDDTGETRSAEEKKAEADAYHENVTKSRKDILVYTTGPLSEPLTIAGPLSAVLYASSSARDTDWFVRMMEVDENGKIFPLVEGKLRARLRNSTSAPELLEPDRIYRYDIDMWQTGITIPPGRALRVEVASASFPMFSRNLNTGGHNETETDYVAAQQVVYHDPEHPSHVLLPVIPQEALSRD